MTLSGAHSPHDSGKGPERSGVTLSQNEDYESWGMGKVSQRAARLTKGLRHLDGKVGLSANLSLDSW